MSTHPTPEAGGPFDVDDAGHGRFDLVREGARRDGVQIAVYEPRYPVAGTKEEQRVIHSIALMFTLSGVFALAFVAAYSFWPANYKANGIWDKFFTPALGLTLGLSLLFLGLAIITWAKKLFAVEVAVQDRHEGPSTHEDRALTGATIQAMGHEFGLKRRPVLKYAIALPVVGLGLAAVTPLVGSLVKDPNKDHLFETTGWNPKHNGGKPVPLTREDGTPIYPEDVSVGGQITVFPGIPGGATNDYADSPTLLINLRNEDADRLRSQLKPLNKGSMWNNFVAYSKICTHLGCPASLYEQQSNILLCPCHQSQFLITNNARPVFGPATRALPMLPISVDETNGYLVATSDYKVAVGPAFWERP
jgi:ubiquinol-cytochrome c reductase iron-sulfur subunit